MLCLVLAILFRNQKSSFHEEKKIINKVINDSILAFEYKGAKNEPTKVWCNIKETIMYLMYVCIHRVKEKILIICEGLSVSYANSPQRDKQIFRIEAQIVQKLSILHNNSE